MPGDDDPLARTEASRKYLEGLLEDVRRAGLPGSEALIQQIEQTLERAPPASSGRAGDHFEKTDDESTPPTSRRMKWGQPAAAAKRSPNEKAPFARGGRQHRD
jgi:hypothetical protein